MHKATRSRAEWKQQVVVLLNIWRGGHRKGIFHICGLVWGWHNTCCVLMLCSTWPEFDLMCKVKDEISMTCLVMNCNVKVRELLIVIKVHIASVWWNMSARSIRHLPGNYTLMTCAGLMAQPAALAKFSFTTAVLKSCTNFMSRVHYITWCTLVLFRYE